MTKYSKCELCNGTVFKNPATGEWKHLCFRQELLHRAVPGKIASQVTQRYQRMITKLVDNK